MKTKNEKTAVKTIEELKNGLWIIQDRETRENFYGRELSDWEKAKKALLLRQIAQLEVEAVLAYGLAVNPDRRAEMSYAAGLAA